MNVIRDRVLADTTEHLPRPGARVRLDSSRCTGCHSFEFPGRDLCPACGAPAVTAPVGPSATLATFTMVLHPAPGSLVEPPFHVGVARFTGGLEVIGLIVGTADGDLRVGQPIECVAVEVTPDVLTYGFQPTAAKDTIEQT